MSRMDDRNYHEARALAELELAEQTSDPAIAMVHRELAALHKRRLIELVDRVDPANEDSPSWSSESV